MSRCVAVMLVAGMTAASAQPAFQGAGGAATPLEFGAKGDGVADDTDAVAKWVAAANAGKFTVADGANRTYNLRCTNGAYLFKQPGQEVRNVTFLMSTAYNPSCSGFIGFAAANVRFQNVVIDGNMRKLSYPDAKKHWFPSIACFYSLGSADHFTANRLTIQNCAARGFLVQPRAGAVPGNVGPTGWNIRGLTINATFGDAFAIYGLSNSVISNFTINQGGTGFQNAYIHPLPYQQTFANGTTNSFCIAPLHQTNHVVFSHGTIRGCGRDGIGFESESHDNTVEDVRTLFGGDGGITINGDKTGDGMPGDGVCAYNTTLSNVTASGNIAAGLQVTCATSGLVVNGGVYSNNGRAVGDTSADASRGIFPNILIASNSRGVVFNEPRVFDDRQDAAVTGAYTAGCVPVTSWKPDLWRDNPRLAFYDAGGAFQGYAIDTSDTASRVCFAATHYNGVTPAAIASGWHVTQRVTHEGVYIANGAKWSGHVQSGGFRRGPPGSDANGKDLETAF